MRPLIFLFSSLTSIFLIIWIISGEAWAGFVFASCLLGLVGFVAWGISNEDKK